MGDRDAAAGRCPSHLPRVHPRDISLLALVADADEPPAVIYLHTAHRSILRDPLPVVPRETERPVWADTATQSRMRRAAGGAGWRLPVFPACGAAGAAGVSGVRARSEERRV